MIIASKTIYVYHDESIPNKNWLLIGLIFVDSKYINDVNKCLHDIKKKENYYNEIHFCKLPSSFAGAWGHKARISKEWISLYRNHLCEFANFSLLAVNKRSPTFDRNNFRTDFYCYNRFTAMALKAGISWHVAPLGYKKIEIIFVSDKKDRCSRPDKGFVDNFEDYLIYRSQLDSFLQQEKNASYPIIERMNLILEDSAKCDLLQLCDILLGATQVALVGTTSRNTKLELGREILSWYFDLLKPPWEQKLRLHRKVNFWLFPNENGLPDKNIPFILDLNPSQLKLF